jgi:di/tricarboxylate transporter
VLPNAAGSCVVTFAQVYVVIVLVVPLTFVFLNRLREDVAALLMATLLGLAQFLGLGVLGPEHTPDSASKALAGFGTPEVMTLLSLFILTYSLDKYGVTRWIARRLLKIGGHSEMRLIGLFATAGALLSLFMNNLAAGALLLPSALDASRQTGIRPSKLLIPIAYGTMLGGAATYLTTANIAVNSLLPLVQPPQKPLGILDFTPVGGVVALVGVAFLTLFGKYLLPTRDAPVVEDPFTEEQLTHAYQLQERSWEIEVTPKSAILGKSIGETGIGETFGVTVLAIKRGRRLMSGIDPDVKIAIGDTLVMIGREDRIFELRQMGLKIHPHNPNEPISSRDTVLAEIIVLPRSSIEGKTLRDLALRSRVGFTAIALWRDNRSYRTDLANFKLQAGDTLLLAGTRERLGSLKYLHEFAVIATASNGNGLDAPRVALTLVIAGAALIAMFAGVRVELAALAAAVALLLTGLVTAEEAYASIKWRAIFLIAGTIAVSVAMVQTNLAQLFGSHVVALVAPLGPIGLVIGTYVLSATLTQLMGGQISPLVAGPITITAAIHLGVSPQAIAVVTAIAGSVSFITPLSHPVNILMITPGNYRFSDFIKSGWILTIVCFVTLVIATMVFWRL